MDTTFLYAKINQYNQEINDCYEQIRKYEKDMDELEGLLERLRMYDSDFSDMQINRKHNLSSAVSELSQQQRYSNNIINGFESSLNEVLYGSENDNAYRCMEEMICIVNREIRKKQIQIEECMKRIAVCNSSIASCENEIKAMEARQKEGMGSRL